MGVKIIDGKEYLENSQGALVPAENVSEQDKLRDRVVRDIMRDAREEGERLRRFKMRVLSDLLGFQETVADKYGASVGGAQGNLSLSSYDGSEQVQIAVNKSLRIEDAALNTAKALIDECLNEWTSEGPEGLRKVVTKAFATDGKGAVNTQGILSLMSLEIGDERWGRAMQALRDGLHVDGKKTFVRFKERTGGDNAWNSLLLDIAKL